MPFKMARPFAIHLVHLTYCRMCGRLLRYQDTDLASLSSPMHSITNKPLTSVASGSLFIVFNAFEHL